MGRKHPKPPEKILCASPAHGVPRRHTFIAEHFRVPDAERDAKTPEHHVWGRGAPWGTFLCPQCGEYTVRHLERNPGLRPGEPVIEEVAAKLRPDANEIAFRVLQEATGERPKTVPGQGPKNPDAVSRGAKGGKKGGAARAKGLTSRERSEAAKAAADHRWEEVRKTREDQR